MSGSCDQVRPLVPELALDLLTGEERDEALAHLGGCASCRLAVEELAPVADSLLLLAPPAEPPPGFEGRVLAAMGMAAERTPLTAPAPSSMAAHRKRRRVRFGLAAAGVAAALVLGAGYAATNRGSSPRDLEAAVFRTAAGQSTGRVVIREGRPERMICTLTDERFEGGYRIEVVLDDGSVRDVGRFAVTGAGRSWGTDLPVAAERVREVRVRGDDGQVHATAEL